MRLVEADPSHIPYLAEHMRPADVVECAAFGRSPAEGLVYALRSCLWAVTALVDELPHAMIGVTSVSMIGGIGEPWMLGTDRIYDHGRDLIRYAPEMIAAMHDTFHRLENGVAANNVRAIAFLRHVGFEICDTPINVGGVPFLDFRKEVPRLCATQGF